MFPSDIDLNDLAVASMETSTVKATIGATTLGLTESIQQHIRLFINTVKNKYAIYDRYFGVDTNGLVGYRLPRSVAIATIKRQISDDLLKTCPVVKETKDWTFSGQTGIFSFTAVMHDGTEIEVNENVYD